MRRSLGEGQQGVRSEGPRMAATACLRLTLRKGSVADVTVNPPKPEQFCRSLFFESDSRAEAAV